MSSFWCPKCGDNLYGDDADAVALAHKPYCHPKIPKANVVNFDPPYCKDCGEETRNHMNNNQNSMCSKIKILKAELCGALNSVDELKAEVERLRKVFMHCIENGVMTQDAYEIYDELKAKAEGGEG